jgi:biotin carboxyl carrier protein
MLQIKVNNGTAFEIEKEGTQWLINGNPADADIQWQPNGQVSLLLDNKSYTGQVEKIDKETKELVLRIDGERYALSIREDIDLLLDKMGINLAAMQKAAPLKAPMPGLVLKVLVAPGQVVNKGDGLLILEAMKMENVLKATGTATIKAIKAEEKSAVEKGAILIEME